MSHRNIRFFLGTALAAALLFACSSCGEVTTIQEEDAAQAIRSQLRSAGVDAEWPAVPELHPVLFFGPDAERVALLVGGPGGSRIEFYRFPDAETAAKAAAGVSEDGFEIPTDTGTANVQWVGPPHYFAKGRMIVLYVENAGNDADGSIDRSVLAVLRDVMGDQFAGR